jgi:hypothetical protein
MGNQTAFCRQTLSDAVYAHYGLSVLWLAVASFTNAISGIYSRTDQPPSGACGDFAPRVPMRAPHGLCVVPRWHMICHSLPPLCTIGEWVSNHQEANPAPLNLARSSRPRKVESTVTVATKLWKKVNAVRHAGKTSARSKSKLPPRWSDRHSKSTGTYHVRLEF